MRIKFLMPLLIVGLSAVLLLAVVAWVGVTTLLDERTCRDCQLNIALQSEAWKESPDELTFAVIGDAGKGNKGQFDVAREMAETYRTNPFGLLITVGDNIYGGDSVTARAEQVIAKPYAPLFDAGVAFRPSLGNHDVDDHPDLQTTLATLGMPGRYYSFTVGAVDFFALDSNNMDAEQLAWLEDNLNRSEGRWQVVYMHHPLYSSGRHSSDYELRESLEPILVDGGADIVFAGHDHNYERTIPQKGIVHVVTGGGSSVRSVGASDFTATSWSQLHFLLVKATETGLHIEAIDDQGQILDTFTVSTKQPSAATSAHQ